jgi:hypothetical protein
MQIPRRPLPLLAALVFLTTNLRAQEAAAKAEAPALRATIGKMLELGGGAFRTTEVQDPAMLRRFRGALAAAGGGDVEVKGSWKQDRRHAELNDGDDSVCLHAGRAAVMDGKDWVLRQGTLGAGQRLPFVLDPQLLLEALAALPNAALAPQHEEAGKVGERDVQVLSTTLAGKPATEFYLSGALPSSGGPMMMIGPGMRGMPQDPPEVTLDLAWHVDPATGLLHRLRIKAYKKDQLPQNMRVEIQGAEAGGDEPEEEIKETDEQGKRIYKRGLPVRKLGSDVSLIDFDIRFSEHGKPSLPSLPEGAKQWLRW